MYNIDSTSKVNYKSKDRDMKVVDNKEYVTGVEAAKILGISTTQFGNWKQKELVRAYVNPVTGRKAYSRKEMEQLEQDIKVWKKVE